MGSSDISGGSLDLIVRDSESSATVLATGDVRPGEDALLAGSCAGADDPTTTQPFGLVLESAETARLVVRGRGPGRVEILDEAGERLFSIENYAHTTAIGQKYEIHSGTFDNGEGRVVDFVAVTDPVPVVVIVAGVALIACAIGAGLSALVADRSARHSGFNDNCRKEGGYMHLDLDFRVKFSIRRRRVACEVRTVPRCIGLDGEVLRSQPAEFEPLH